MEAGWKAEPIKVISDMSFIDNSSQWTGIKIISKVETIRYFKSTGKTETESRYYISSLQSAAELLTNMFANIGP